MLFSATSIFTRLKKLLLLLLLFLCNTVKAQEHFIFSSMPLEKELSSKHITCFFQDSRGFMWIGTENGLNFFNGNSIKFYKHDFTNGNSILNNFILHICEDAEKNIWISTEVGISKFNTSTQQFVSFTKDYSNNNIGYKPKAFADKQGSIWLAGDGLFKFNKQLQQFEKISLNINIRVNGFLEDSKGRIWLSSFNGLYLFDKLTNKIVRFDKPPTDENGKKFGVIFLPVQEDAQGNLFVGTWLYGLLKILPEQQRLINISTNNTCLNYTSQQLNGNNLFWFVCNGLTVFNNNTLKSYKQLHVADNPYSIYNDEVSALYTDRQGQVWIGYTSSGVQLLNPYNQLIKTYLLNDKNGKIRSANAFAEKEGNLYIGGWYADALCKLNKNYTIEKWWKYLPSTVTKEASNISHAYIDKQGIIWLTSFNGLVAVNEQSKKEQLFTFDSAYSKNNRLIDILPEGDSILWLSTYNNGLAKFSFKTQQLKPVVNNNKTLIWEIDADDKHIWCANNGGSLLGYNKQQQKFETFTFDSIIGTSIFYGINYSRLQNALYIATSSGLLKVQLPNMQAKIFTEKDGLPANSTNVLEWQNDYELWVGTNEGLSLFNIKNNSFKNFYSNNGLATERIEHGLYKTSNNKLLIGAEGFMMEIDANAIKPSTSSSSVSIIQVNESDSILQPKLVNQQKIIELDYFQNNLSFEFAMPDYLNADGNRFFYQLEGWDKSFIQSKRGFARYSKLLPGKYVFKVKGINHDGIETNATDSITIIIRPPFWKRWWFIALISVLFLLLLIYVVRYISQRNLKEKLLRLEKKQAIEKERNRISQDMHDELGSGLTKIAIMSEVVKKQLAEPEKAKYQLDNISTSSRELVDNLQDIIWTLNPKNDTLDSLVAYTREYATKFLEPFDIELKVVVPDNFIHQKLSEEERRNIYLTIKETLNNIVKHAQCSIIELKVEQQPSTIITIKDNGKGFNINETRAFGNGIKNMHTRMQQINARYQIQSILGSGSTTTIHLKANTFL